MRILVVEDELALADFIAKALGADGYAVSQCHDGPSGEAAALTGDYALVILDVLLPGKDGREVLRAIRAREPDLPVILLTARGAVEQKVEGLDLGANDYMTKPVLARGALGTGAGAPARPRSAGGVGAGGQRHPARPSHPPCRA